MKNRSFLWLSLTIFFIIGIFLPSILSFVVNWWWFEETGFTQLLLTKINYQILAGVGIAVFSALFLLINFLLATASKNPWLVVLPPALVGQTLTLSDKILKRIGIIGSLAIAIFLGFVTSFSWTIIAQFFFATPFGITDPIFNKDISFYVFTLPFYSLGLGLLKFLILASLIGCVAIYLLRGSINIAELLPKIKFIKIQKTTDPVARGHVGILLFLFLLTLAASTYLSQYALLNSEAGVVSGASFTDTTLLIPLLNISVYVYILASVMAFVYGINGKLKPLFGAIFLSFLVGFATAIIPPVFQKIVVAPNELTKETPFIKHNIQATRIAYGLNDIQKKTIAADKPLTASDLDANNLTIKNVRLWDREPLLSTFSQIQEIRTYYEFASVDNDRYLINNELRQVMLSPRELASESLPNKNWINEHLTFTHGYGIAAGPVNQVTPEGLPVLFVKDLPPKSEVKELEVRQPEIYFGELVNEYVLVKTTSKEFNYPKGEENVYATYTGTGGVEMNTPLKKLFYALHFSSLKLLLSSDITPQTRIMYNRNIRERVEKIAPFLTYDHDPYLVVADGKLYWILDAYTTSNRYPYAQKINFKDHTVNYLRNSVKIVVDAYHGSITFYQADMNDPIITTYTKLFPDTFKPLSEMPKNLLSHLRYPEDIFIAQTEIYTTYHMDDPQIFYNKEDQWEVPVISQPGEMQTANANMSPMAPRHMIMKLPGEEKEEFILMLPFTPRAKDNLSAWMVARNDGELYGKLAVYSFPKDKLIFGPKQIIGRINQDPQVSQQISLWDQRGSQVIQGPLLVIPIEQSLVYIRPLYLKAETGKIPELKRIIVAYENKIAMEETLERGLQRIFGTQTDQPTDQPTTPTSPAQPAQEQQVTLEQAEAAYNNALTAQRNGDWARYGEEIRKLGDILQKLNQ